MKISVIIPAYNEQDIILENMLLLERKLIEYFDDFEIVIVNDGSTDNTWEIIKKNLSSEHFIDAGYTDNRGKGGALKAGVEASTGDIFVMTDCDLAYGTEVICQATKLLENTPDKQILIGSRSASKEGFEGYPLIRRLASRAYFKLISCISRIKVSDSQCGFKAYRKECAKKLFDSLVTTGFAFDLEILMRAEQNKLGIIEMPVKVKEHGNSKISVVRDSFKMLGDVMKIKKLIKQERKL